jgi:hypothetical protein
MVCVLFWLMSNYIPTYTKKRQRQAKLENDLRRLVSKNVKLDKLIAAAEEVRAARIRTINAKRQHCCIFGSTVRHDAEIASLRGAAIEVILREFGIQIG